MGVALKWSETLKRRKKAGQREPYRSVQIRLTSYRPFSRIHLYTSDVFVDRPGQSDVLFPFGQRNTAICFSDIGSRTEYCVQAVEGLADLHFGAAVDAYQQVTRYRFADGSRVDNITDWALDQFRAHYASDKAVTKRPITKDAIFHYVYGVLYDPLYRETYADDLKRSFPRIPFHADFWRWAEWGEALMVLHIGYEQVEPWPLRRIDVPDAKAAQAGQSPNRS